MVLRYGGAWPDRRGLPGRSAAIEIHSFEDRRSVSILAMRQPLSVTQ